MKVDDVLQKIVLSYREDDWHSDLLWPNWRKEPQ